MTDVFHKLIHRLCGKAHVVPSTRQVSRFNGKPVCCPGAGGAAHCGLGYTVAAKALPGRTMAEILIAISLLLLALLGLLALSGAGHDGKSSNLDDPDD